MTTALIGHTGFVGSNLLRHYPFDDLYNSKNSESMAGHSYDLVVCAGVPAEKWKANQDPKADQVVIDRLKKALATMQTRRLILISTVDVYPIPVNVNEDSAPDWQAASAYGRHRHQLEEFVAAHFNALICRLPGLFGKGLKKNMIYDFLHGHQLDKIHADAQFQFYGLDHLWTDLQVAERAQLSVINMATEPVSVGEVAQSVFNLEFKNHPTGVTPARYAMTSKHAALFGGSAGYLQTKARVLSEMKKFVNAERHPG